MDEASATIDALMNRRTKIQKALDSRRQAGIEMHNQLSKMRKMGYTNVSDINQRIAEIEEKLMTTSVTLKVEKIWASEISELRKRRSQVKHLEESLSTRDAEEQIATINCEMVQHRDGLSALEKLKAVLDTRCSQVGVLEGHHGA